MEGRIAATNAILGATRQATYDVVPSGSFTDPNTEGWASPRPGRAAADVVSRYRPLR